MFQLKKKGQGIPDTWLKFFNNSLYKKLGRNHFHKWKILPQTKDSHELVDAIHSRAGRLHQGAERSPLQGLLYLMSQARVCLSTVENS